MARRKTKPAISREAVPAEVVLDLKPTRPLNVRLMPEPEVVMENVLPTGSMPFAGLTYDEVIEQLVENINNVFVSNDCTLADAKVAVDAFKDQLLMMTKEAEGPRAAQELAFQFMQGCLPYIFNAELAEDPRGSFKAILKQVQEQLAPE